MNPVTRDFVRRWWWLFTAQFAITAIAWTQHDRSRGAMLHLEIFPAVAMSWDLVRGLIRPCFGLPMKRSAVARGLWLPVVVAGPVLTIAAMLLAAAICRLSGMEPPSSAVLTLHGVISFLLAGAVQFLLTGLPTRPDLSLAGKIRDGFLALLWGLCVSATFWISFVIPHAWDKIGTGAAIVLIFLTGISIASYFSIQSMLIWRALPRQGSFPVQLAASASGSPLHGVRGWRIWLGQELRWQALVPFMVLMVIGSLELMARLSNPGAGSLMTGGPNRYSSLTVLAAMLVVPLFGMVVAPLRAFRALPVARGTYAALVALRPVVYSLNLFLTCAVFSWAFGRATGTEGRALVIFVFLGSLWSLLQALLVRSPRFPVAIAMVMIASPVAMTTIPLVFQAGAPVFWMPLASALLIPVSWLLHRRWLRTSSGIYRNQLWLMRFPAGGGAR